MTSRCKKSTKFHKNCTNGSKFGERRGYTASVVINLLYFVKNVQVCYKRPLHDSEGTPQFSKRPGTDFDTMNSRK
jgi:hypothetical protein